VIDQNKEWGFMGLFDFVKDAGEKIFGRKESEAKSERAKAEALTGQVQALGLKVDGLQIDYDDGVAKVGGTVPSQEEKEKVILVLGNTQGVAQVDDQIVVREPAPEAAPTPEAAPRPAATMYTVKSGDTLSKIAKAHYGDAMKYPVIFEANKPMLKDPDRIYPGQVLRIPPQ
jgi:nucleoid-associated protein YgaU